MTVDPQQLARTIREAIDHLHREAVLYWISDGCDDAPIETHGQKDDALDALDLLATQKLMRHQSAATTERSYIHIEERTAVARVQRMMRDPMQDGG